MICRDGMHFSQWLSSGTTAAPAHLRCQCGRTQQGDLDEPIYDYVERGKVERLTAERDAALADAARLRAAGDRMAEAITRTLESALGDVMGPLSVANFERLNVSEAAWRALGDGQGGGEG